MRLEVVTLPVTDVDRAKEFYQNLGWRTDADFVLSEDVRTVQADAATLGMLDLVWKGDHHRSIPAPLLAFGGWSSPTSKRPVRTSSAVAWKSAMCSTATVPSFRFRWTRNTLVPSSYARQAIQTAMGGCSRRSKTRLPGREWED